MLTEQEIKQVEARKEAIIARYGEQIYQRVSIGFVPPDRLIEILELPIDNDK